MNTTQDGSRMPVIFAGHGSPMNAIEVNRWSEGFTELAASAPHPLAVLAISAHWYVDGSFVMANDAPQTIHDFYGFPRALFEVQYPAAGRPELADRVRHLLSEDSVQLSHDWGIDHGTWSVLRHMYPDAQIPVIQLSIDRRAEPRTHLELGRALAPLRHEGVLILCSGNLVHNLRDAGSRMRSGHAETPDWAERFDRDVSTALLQHDTESLLDRLPESNDGRLAHPTPDHWLPLLYAVGACDEGDAVRFPMHGFDWGSISMRNVVFGEPDGPA